jgi:hypothetical protein
LTKAAVSALRRRAGAELLEERRFVGFGGGEMLLLDVAETADLFRDRGQPDCDEMIVRRQTRQNLVEHRLVVADQFAFGAAFERPSEWIERRPS